MRKWLLSIGLAVGLTVAGCCTVDNHAIEQIEATHDLILPEYLDYVENDPDLSDAEKDDRKKLADSLEGLTDGLKEDE